MNKYKTGKYLILIFDSYGTKQHTFTEETLIEARRIANDKAIDGGTHSILKVIENSGDNRWKGQDVDVDAMAAAARQVV